MPGPKDPQTHLGAAIRNARLAKGWKSQRGTVSALAAVGYRRSQDTVSRWEVGNRIPDPDELFALGVVLDRPEELRDAQWRDGEEAANETMRMFATLRTAGNSDIPGSLSRLSTIRPIRTLPHIFRALSPAAA